MICKNQHGKGFCVRCEVTQKEYEYMYVLHQVHMYMYGRSVRNKRLQVRKPYKQQTTSQCGNDSFRTKKSFKKGLHNLKLCWESTPLFITQKYSYRKYRRIVQLWQSQLCYRSLYTYFIQYLQWLVFKKSSFAKFIVFLIQNFDFRKISRDLI